MNTKDNQRTRLSRMMLRNALMELLSEKKSIEKIPVKELCERAELNRSTFYAHYDRPEDLLKEIEDDLLTATEEHLKKIGEGNEEGAYRYILSFLKFIKANGSQFRTLLVDTYDPDFKSEFMSRSLVQFVESLDFILPKETEQYVYSYILNGSIGVITQWIRSDYAVNENTLVEMLFSINRSAIAGM